VDNGPGGPFAIFATRPDGWAALGLWLLDAHDNRGLRSVGAMIDVFAPPSENATASYAAGVAAKLGLALDADVDVHVVATRQALCQAIAHWEDYQAQWPIAEIAAGMILCDARWPAFLAAATGHAAPAGGFPDVSADELNAAELSNVSRETEQP
jgi:hypothetical protein